MKKLWHGAMRVLALVLGTFTFTACYGPGPGCDFTWEPEEPQGRMMAAEPTEIVEEEEDDVDSSENRAEAE